MLPLTTLRMPFSPSNFRFVCRASATLSWLVLVAILFSSPLGAATFRPGVQVGILNSGAISEASGLVASRRNQGVLWVHNDSGFILRLFAVSTNGQLLSTWEVPNIFNGDAEDVTIGPGPISGIPYLYLGDIGDNTETRESIRVIRIPEPAVALNTAGSPPTLAFDEATAIYLVYPDRAHNSEALMSDPITGDLFIVTKHPTLDASFLYRAPKAALDASTQVTLEYITTLRSRKISAGDISPNGSEILLRSGSAGALWKRLPGKTVSQTLRAGATVSPVIGEPLEPNGEAIAFDAAGLGYYTVSEGLFQPLYFFARSGPSPEASVLKQAQLEQSVTIVLKGNSLTNTGPRPKVVSVSTRSFLMAVGQDLFPGSIIGNAATFWLKTSAAGSQQFVLRQKGFSDVNISSYVRDFDIGNDRPEAVIVPAAKPGLPYKITTRGDYEFQYGPSAASISVAGSTVNRVIPKTITFLGTPLVVEPNQTAAKVTGSLRNEDTPLALLSGTVAVGAPKAVDLAAFFAEGFEVWGGGFVVINDGLVSGAWEYRPKSGLNVDGAWAVNGTSDTGGATSSALRSRSFFIPAIADAALIFDHRYSFQRDDNGGLDGGVVRVRVNGGPFETVSAGAFVAHGYTDIVRGESALNGVPAFTGVSGGYAEGDYVRSICLLGRLAAGDVVTIEFLGAWNETGLNESPNWQLGSMAVVKW